MTLRFWQKPVAAALVASFLLPLALIAEPMQADAAASNCAAVVAGAVASIAPIAAVEKTIGVTVSSGAQTTAGTISAGSGYGTFFKDCILTPLAINLAKSMLRNITSSIVNWINGGFNGNPSFVQNLHGLMTDTTDQVIGNFISNDLGAGFLCSPFSFRVRLAVAESYMPYQQRAACTLTQITQNVNGFVQSDNSGGWDNWLQVTTEPQNNVYGATVLAENELSAQIASKLDVQNRTLDWGKGFRSWQVCDQYETQSQANAAATRGGDLTVTNTDSSFTNFNANQSQNTTYQFGANGAKITAPAQTPTFTNAQINTNTSIAGGAAPKCLHYTTETPGTVVESQLETTLGSGVRQLEVANDLDAVVGALTNQLMSQVVSGAKGLLGLGGSGSSENYNQSISSYVTDPALAAAIDQGISQYTSDAHLNSLFTESSSSDASTTAATEPTPVGGTVVTAPDTHIEAANTPNPVTSIAPLSYEVHLYTNVATSSLQMKTTLQQNGKPVAFLTPFSSFRIAYGPKDGVLVDKTISLDTDASVLWNPISMAANSTLIFKYSGIENVDDSGQPIDPGDYTLDTELIAADGTVLQTVSTPIAVQ